MLRNEVIYDPWHYVPGLARKPGGLRNGAPFLGWVLPSAMEKVRRKHKAVDDGDRQMVSILTCVLTDGLSAVEAACQEAIEHGVSSAVVILNILGPAAAIRRRLHRQRDGHIDAWNGHQTLRAFIESRTGKIALDKLEVIAQPVELAQVPIDL
ncbi:hypothetical protein J2X13_004119 [Aminobacter aminovorans]|nr:hypothetical protein [Aminobacter aminovorans]